MAAAPVRLDNSTPITLAAVLEADTMIKPLLAGTAPNVPVSELVAMTNTLYAVEIPVAVVHCTPRVVLAVIDDCWRSQVPKINPASVPLVLFPPTIITEVLAVPETVIAVVEAYAIVDAVLLPVIVVVEVPPT